MKMLDQQQCQSTSAGAITVADNFTISDAGISQRCLPKLQQAVNLQFSGLLLPHDAIKALSGVCTEQDMRAFGANVMRASTVYIDQLAARVSK